MFACLVTGAKELYTLLPLSYVVGLDIFNHCRAWKRIGQSKEDQHVYPSPYAVVIAVFQGVESERCASFTASMEAGKPIYTKAHSTLADGKLCLCEARFSIAYLLFMHSLTGLSNVENIK